MLRMGVRRVKHYNIGNFESLGMYNNWRGRATMSMLTSVFNVKQIPRMYKQRKDKEHTCKPRKRKGRMNAPATNK